ncbi:flagellar hook-associated protein FlgK [Angustibacter peucedani]
MSSTFSGLSTALNALMSQRAALTLTGQNIANANTPGYTRQRAELAAVVTPTQAGMMSSSLITQNGGGVTVSSIRRLADAFVDARQREAHSQASYSTATSAALDQVEQVLGEPSDTGLSSQLQEFWGAWQGVANTPDSVPARQALLSKAATVVGTIQRGRAALDSAYGDTRAQLDALVTQVNTTAKGVADLNDKIRIATASGNPPNELMDQRDQLVLQLSELVGAKSSPNSDGSVSVSVNGVGIVSTTRAATLSASGGASIDSSTSTPLQLTWSTGAAATFTAGQVGGVVDVLRQVYPEAADGYDQVAAALASSVNAVHATGQDLDGTATGDFFVGTTAKSLGLAFTDPRKVGAAAQTGTASYDGSVADKLGQLATSATGADVRWSAFVAATGVASASAQTQLAVQTSISQQSDASRASSSGVSLDEEMSNMLMYQRAYEGAARVMTAVDEMLDTLINRVGTVGR